MKKIILLDTSIGTSNMGDYIIMECVREELFPLFKNSFIYSLPTHLPVFHSFAVFRNSYAVQNYANCDLKFAGGSNLLVKNLRTHYPQWNINPFNSKPLRGSILVGVGAGAGEYTNRYTTQLYRKVLNGQYYHSVRDERSRRYVEEQLGLKALNTGCVTMWKLTPAFCNAIPCQKAERVVFTLTGRSNREPIRKEEQDMIDILVRNYQQVYFWVQGDRDAEYFQRFKNTREVHIIPPSLEAYRNLLKEDNLDYVGTRLHGGIFAMRHKKRAVIIAIDERAEEINKSNHLNCISLKDVKSLLEPKIQSAFRTEITMPYDTIQKWKSQFI